MASPFAGGDSGLHNVEIITYFSDIHRKIVHFDLVINSQVEILAYVTSFRWGFWPTLLRSGGDSGLHYFAQVEILAYVTSLGGDFCLRNTGIPAYETWLK